MNNGEKEVVLVASGSRLLSGRSNGEKAKEKYHLTKEYLEHVTLLKLSDDGDLTVSNSYFLGMLEDFLKRYKSKSDLFEHIDFENLSESNQKELVRGINRGFSSIRSAMH